MGVLVDQTRTSSSGAYIINPESAAETVRLLNSARLYMHLMGGLLPEQPDPTAFHDVLDIGCGPGVWALDVAFAYPDSTVVGVDISEQRIKYGRVMAKEQRLSNASFRVMDAQKPLAFPDASFDLVNAQFLFEDLARDGWKPFLRECWRVVRPGGIIRLTEYELGVSNSPAHEHLWNRYLQAMFQANRTGTPCGRNLGIINILEPFLQKAGFRATGHCVYAVEYSSRAGKHQEWCEDLMLKVHHFLPFLEKMGIASQTELEQNARRMEKEMCYPDFGALGIVLTSWGKRPVQ